MSAFTIGLAAVGLMALLVAAATVVCVGLGIGAAHARARSIEAARDQRIMSARYEEPVAERQSAPAPGVRAMGL